MRWDGRGLQQTSTEKVRSYKEQFASPTIERIDELISRIITLRKLGSIYSYYLYELERCLRVGLLLAAVHVGAALLELYVRHLWAIMTLKAKGKTVESRSISKQILVAEQSKDVGFATMVDETFSHAWSPSRLTELKMFYKHVRIPIQHGLFMRFSDLKSKVGDDLYELLLPAIGAQTLLSEFRIASSIEMYSET